MRWRAQLAGSLRRQTCLLPRLNLKFHTQLITRGTFDHDHGDLPLDDDEPTAMKAGQGTLVVGSHNQPDPRQLERTERKRKQEFHGFGSESLAPLFWLSEYKAQLCRSVVEIPKSPTSDRLSAAEINTNREPPPTVSFVFIPNRHRAAVTCTGWLAPFSPHFQDHNEWAPVVGSRPIWPNLWAAACLEQLDIGRKDYPG